MEQVSSNVGPFSSDVGPFSSDVGPFSSNVGPFSSNVGPFSSNVGPFSSNVEPFSSVYESPSPYVTTRKPRLVSQKELPQEEELLEEELPQEELSQQELQQQELQQQELRQRELQQRELQQRELLQEEEELTQRDDTDILFISTHGLINCAEIEPGIENEPNLIEIPEGMEVVKITLGLEGCANLMGEEQYRFALMVLDEEKDKLLSNDDTIVERAVHDATESIKYFQNYTAKKNLNIVNKEIKESKNPKKIKETYKYLLGFIHGIKSSVKKFILQEGDLIMNKTYIRDRHDIENKCGEYDYTITIINSPDKKDVLSELKRETRFGHQKITTKELLNYFKNKGIHRLIIFDYSCSVYETKDYNKKKKIDRTTRYLDERETRRLRRETTYPYGGKYKYTKKIKNNKMKNNKIKNNKIKNNKIKNNKIKNNKTKIKNKKRKNHKTKKYHRKNKK